jgi:hypothetical protein
MFVLKNLAVLDDRPKALQERVFRRLFRIAEIEQLGEAERLAYRESQKIYWDYMNSLRSAEKAGREKEALEMEAVIREKEEALREKDAIIREKDAVIEAVRQNNEELVKSQNTTVENLFGKGFSAEQISEVTKLDIRRVNEIITNLTAFT